MFVCVCYCYFSQSKNEEEASGALWRGEGVRRSRTWVIVRLVATRPQSSRVLFTKCVNCNTADTARAPLQWRWLCVCAIANVYEKRTRASNYSDYEDDEREWEHAHRPARPWQPKWFVSEMILLEVYAQPAHEISLTVWTIYNARTRRMYTQCLIYINNIIILSRWNIVRESY